MKRCKNRIVLIYFKFFLQILKSERDDEEVPGVEELTLGDLLIELEIDQSDSILEPFHRRIIFCSGKLKG